MSIEKEQLQTQLWELSTTKERCFVSDLERRFTYHKPDAEQSAACARIRELCKQLAGAIELLAPECREQSLAITNVEQASMWANAAIVRPRANPVG